MSDTKEARRLIAHQAANIAKILKDNFSMLEDALRNGTVHHFTVKQGEKSGLGMAEFLYTSSAGDDVPDLDYEIHKLKSLINAVVALEKLEENP